MVDAVGVNDSHNVERRVKLQSNALQCSDGPGVVEEIGWNGKLKIRNES